MSLLDELLRAAHRAGGGTQTIDARQSFARQYVAWCRANNIQTRHIRDIKSAQIKDFVAYLLAPRAEGGREILPRTCCTKMGGLRKILAEGGGRTPPTNQELGIAGASRAPARDALTPENYEHARAVLADRGSWGERACLALSTVLGLRPGEQIQAHKSLRSWDRVLRRAPVGQPVQLHVIHGTKNGRPRWTEPLDREQALAAIGEALAAAKAGGGRLVQGATLKAARSRYSREMRAAGLLGRQSPHSARYAYAQSRIDQREAAGDDHREATAAVSVDLGHGDGRGRWVDSVYNPR